MRPTRIAVHCEQPGDHVGVGGHQQVAARLTELAADKAGAESLKVLLEGPTAFTFVKGDAALAAKAIATFRRQHDVLAFKGGTMDGETLSIEEIEAIAKLPARDLLNAQLVGVMASPVTGLVRGLNQLIGGLAQQLGQIAEQGLVGGADEAQTSDVRPQDEGAEADEAPAESGEAPAEPEEAPAEAEEPPAEEETPAAEDAPVGDPGNGPQEEETSGDEPAETDETEAAPSEGDEKAEED